MQALDEPALGWTLVLRRQPVHLVGGRPEGGYTDACELICRFPWPAGMRRRTGAAGDPTG